MNSRRRRYSASGVISELSDSFGNFAILMIVRTPPANHLVPIWDESDPILVDIPVRLSQRQGTARCERLRPPDAASGGPSGQLVAGVDGQRAALPAGFAARRPAAVARRAGRRADRVPAGVDQSGGGPERAERRAPAR